MNNNEFKITKFKESTVYTLESATAGGTSAGNVASVSKPIGGVRRRTGDDFFAQEDADPIKPRRGPLRPQTGGGEHKDKTKTIPRKEKHRKPMDMSETARLSPAAKLQRAFDREQAKSSANRDRGEKVMSQARTEWEKKQAAEKDKTKDVAEGQTTRGGFGGSASQAHQEIEWLKKKIASLPPTKEKQIRDLQRQIREREIAISLQKEGVAEVTKVDPNAPFDYDAWSKSGKTTTPKHFGPKGAGTKLADLNRKNWEEKKKKQQGMSEGRYEFDKKTGQMAHNTTDADQRHGLYIDGKLVKTYNSREACDNVKRRDPKFKSATIKKIAEGLPKDPNAPKKVQDRKTGKHYDPNKAFDKTMKDPKVKDQLKRMAQKESVAEATGDKTFDKMLKGITSKTAVTKQQKIDRREERKQNQERAKNAFGNMFGGPGAGIGNLSIRKGPPKDVAEGIFDRFKKPKQDPAEDALRRKLMLKDRETVPDMDDYSWQIGWHYGDGDMDVEAAYSDTYWNGGMLPSPPELRSFKLGFNARKKQDMGEDHSTATGGWGQGSMNAARKSGALSGAGHDDRMMEDEYIAELSSRLEEKLAKNAPVKAYIDDFAKAAKTPNAKGHHQFKNKSPEKVRQMAMAASYGAKNPSKKK